MQYYVYMVRCADGSLYTGITTDTNRRVQQHNGALPGGAMYTRSRKPVELVYIEEYKSKGEALSREAIIKKLLKKEKEKLLSANKRKKSKRAP